MDRAAIETVLREAYAARTRGEVADVTRYFAPDARLTMNGAPEASPLPTLVSSTPAIEDALSGLVSHFQFLSHEILTTVVEGDRAAVHCRVHVRSSITGEEAVTEVLDLYEFRDGRIVSFIEFADTALAARLMGAGAAAAPAS